MEQDLQSANPESVQAKKTITQHKQLINSREQAFTSIGNAAKLIRKAARERQAMRQAIEKLCSIADLYVSLYASVSGKTQDDYFASAHQALYVANSGSLFAWSAAGNNNPTQATAALSDPSEVAQVLYWSYLFRHPASEETAIVAEQLASAGDQRNEIIHESTCGTLALPWSQRRRPFRYCG